MRGARRPDDRARSLGERLALLHAEAMLLVDDGEPEPRERDALAQEGLGADGHGRRAGRERHQAPLPLGARDAAGQEQRLQAGGRQQPVEGAEVLLGERLGRNQQRRLRPASTVWQIASAATTVLPEPTSP